MCTHIYICTHIYTYHHKPDAACSFLLQTLPTRYSWDIMLTVCLKKTIAQNTISKYFEQKVAVFAQSIDSIDSIQCIELFFFCSKQRRRDIVHTYVRMTYNINTCTHIHTIHWGYYAFAYDIMRIHMCLYAHPFVSVCVCNIHIHTHTHTHHRPDAACYFCLKNTADEWQRYRACSQVCVAADCVGQCEEKNAASNYGPTTPVHVTTMCMRQCEMGGTFQYGIRNSGLV